MSYLYDIRRRAEQRRRERIERHRANALTTRVSGWFASLPPTERRRAYSLSELAELFRAAPNALGPALHQLGWERRRRWSGNGPYIRFWIPPKNLTSSSNSRWRESSAPVI